MLLVVNLVSEYVSEALSGHERTLAAEGTTHTGYTVKTEEITEQVYDIPVVDDVMDLKFSGARVAYISIEKVEKTAAEKPNICLSAIQLSATAAHTHIFST